MIGSKGGQREGCRQNCRTRMAGAAAIMGTLVAEAGTAVGSDRSSSGGGGVNVVDIGMKEHDMKNYDDDENGSGGGGGGGGGIIANAAAASADRRRMEREKRRKDEKIVREEINSNVIVRKES